MLIIDENEQSWVFFENNMNLLVILKHVLYFCILMLNWFVPSFSFQFSLIEKCDSKGLLYKIRDLSASPSTPYQFMFVLERIIEFVPGNPFASTDAHITEELELLFAVTVAKDQLSRGDLYRMIDSVYLQLSEKYVDWVYTGSSDSSEMESIWFVTCVILFSFCDLWAS